MSFGSAGLITHQEPIVRLLLKDAQAIDGRHIIDHADKLIE